MGGAYRKPFDDTALFECLVSMTRNCQRAGYMSSLARVVGLELCLCLGLISGATAGGTFTSPVADVLERPAMILLGDAAQRSVLQSIASAEGHLLAVGERGIALQTDNPDEGWQQGVTPVSVTLTDVALVSPQEGWAVGHGGVVLETRDGGRSWIKRLDGQDAARINLKWVEEHQAIGENGEQRVAMAKRLVEEGADKPFFAVYPLNRQSILVAGAFNLAFLTRDGGRTWKSFSALLPNPREAHLYDIAGAEQVIFMVGEFGLILRSLDGGRSFEKLESPYHGSFFSAAYGAERVVVAGLNGNAFVSDNKGETWRTVEGLGHASISSVRLESDGGFLFADQSGAAYRLVPGEPARAVRLKLPPASPATDAIAVDNESILRVGLSGVVFNRSVVESGKP